MENGNTATDTPPEETRNSAQDYFGYEPTDTSSDSNKPQEVIDYQAEVNRLLKETKVTGDGKFDYPADTPPWARIAIANEKKFRDIQRTDSKAMQDNKLLTAEIDVLKSKLAGKTALTQEQHDELDTLKITDPEAYFDKRTEYEASANAQYDTELADVRSKTAGEIEVDRRNIYVEDFNKGRKIPITQELIDNEVPPKFFKQLEANKVTFEEFMSNVAEYVDTPKVMGNQDKDTEVTNLSDVAGGSKPSKEKRYDNLAESYANLVF